MSRNALAVEGRRNAEVLRAMGMRHRAAARWLEVNKNYMAANEAANDAASGLGGMSKVFRMILQSGVLAVGAYLVVHGESTAGIIIASSILTSRALAPVELAIANWKGFVSARQSARRLDQLLTLLPKEDQPMELPPPEQSLTVDRIHVVPPGGERAVLQNVSFSLTSGQGLGIIGPSGSGKSSSLAPSLVYGPSCTARSGSMVPHSINGHPRDLDGTSDIFRRTSNCSMEASRSTLPASIRRRRRRRCWRPPARLERMNSSCRFLTGMAPK